MEKFSFFDFVSFLLPGGTILILLYILLTSQFQIPCSFEQIGIELLIIPFLFLSYLIGHLLSLLGRKIENKLPSMKQPWTQYLKNNPKDAKRVNKIAKKQFKCEPFLDDNNNVLPLQSGIVHDKIYDYLEIQGKDEKIKILFSQYGFFRNSLALWFCTSIVLIIFIATYCINLINLRLPVYYYAVSLAISIILFLFSITLMKQRKFLFMSYVYRNYLANSINK
ncbi:MAG: hypothetical protein HOO91_21135 [Bacteroidales bacterium]|nr:hypothetical protein [Bacteroidales bacterium]